MDNLQNDSRTLARSPSRVGDLAPDFFLQDITGQGVRLTDSIRNGYVVLIFYRGGWCPLCSKQLSSIANDYEKFTAAGAKILAISSEQPEKGKELLLKLKLPYTLLADPDHKAIELYGILAGKRELKDIPALTHRRKRDYAIPSIFIIDREGKIRYRYVGKSFRDRPRNEEILRELGRLSLSDNITNEVMTKS